MKCHILAVEDSATQAEALCALLEEAGYAVTLARSGEEALERVSAGRFDLVLSDIMMPGISGYDLCRRLKADPEWRNLPVVLLTSLTDPMDIVRGLEVGADNYITKPYEPEHLLARIRHVMDNHRLRRNVKTSMGVTVSFLGTELMITSDKEQILDLLLSSVEDVIRTNRALEASRRELAEAHAQLESYARGKAHEADLSAERYRILTQSAIDAIFVLDREGRITEANARAVELLGRTEDDILGQPLTNFVAPDEVQEFRSRLLDGASLEAVEQTIVRGDGRAAYCEVSKSLAGVGSDELVLAICRDVTERRLAADRLRRRERQLAEAQHIARLGSWESDLTQNTLDWSDEMYAIFGVDPEAFDSTFDGFIARVYPDDRQGVVQAIDDALQGRSTLDIEYRVVRSAEDVAVIHARADVLRDDAGVPVGMIGTAQDITERNRVEEALHRSEEQLQQAQKMEAVGRLAGGIAHDFNNILTAIKGNTTLLFADLPRNDPAREDLKEIDKCADRAADLTRQLLTFSRKQVIEPRVLDLNMVIAGAEKMLRRVLREDVELICRTEPRLARVKADPGQIDQVLMNLVVNARDAMPEGGTLILETQNVELGEEYVRLYPYVRPGSYVLLAVSDTGSGMPREIQESVFEPFFTTKLPGEGTGLGLSTVYGIVKQSDGYINVYSEPGRGSTFKVYLPQVREEVADEEPARAPELPAERSETVLLVEDDPAVRNVARKALERNGCTVLAAANGAEALRVCDEHDGPVHLLLTDVVLPGMSGPELAERARKSRPDLRVLFMSGYTDAAISHHGVLDPGVEFIHKPFGPDALIRKVSEVLGIRPRTASLAG